MAPMSHTLLRPVPAKGATTYSVPSSAVHLLALTGTGSLIDGSEYAYPYQMNGIVTTNSSIAKFGSTSYQFGGSGFYGHLYYGTYAVPLPVWNTDYTIEFWLYCNVPQNQPIGHHTICHLWPFDGYSPYGTQVHLYGDNTIHFNNAYAASAYADGIPKQQWCHVACVQHGMSRMIFIDGQLKGIANSSVHPDIANWNVRCTIGAFQYGENPDYSCDETILIDGLRIVRSALYINNFALPTTQFTTTPTSPTPVSLGVTAPDYDIELTYTLAPSSTVTLYGTLRDGATHRNIVASNGYQSLDAITVGASSVPFTNAGTYTIKITSCNSTGARVGGHSSFSCTPYGLVGVKFSPVPNIASFDCEAATQITSFDVSTHTSLASINCYQFGSANLDLRNAVGLNYLSVTEGQMQSVMLPAKSIGNVYLTDCANLTTLRGVGTSTSGGYYHNSTSLGGGFDLRYAGLSAAALNQFYTDIAPGTGYIFTQNAAGAAGDNPSIATAKGYTVV